MLILDCSVYKRNIVADHVQFRGRQGAQRALGVWAAMGGVGMSLGLLLGGLLTSYIGWKATFFVNVPIALLVIILTLLPLRKAGRLPEHAIMTQPARFP